MTEVDKYAKIIWDYMLMHQELKKADAIFALGSNDIRVAQRALELYKDGYAPLVICAGGFGKETHFEKAEAEVFRDVLIDGGVPEENILIEKESTNTGENILFVRKMLRDKDVKLNSIILVQKPYMERRTYATFKKQWPELDCVVTSPQIAYVDYWQKKPPEFKYRFTDVMAGDLQRIKEYPAKGFQIEQDIPEEVWNAYLELVKLGFTKYAIKD